MSDTTSTALQRLTASLREPNYASDRKGRCARQVTLAEQAEAEAEALRERIRLLEGAMKADDERLRTATEAVGMVPWDCDTADALADEVLALRAALSAAVQAGKACEDDAQAYRDACAALDAIGHTYRPADAIRDLEAQRAALSATNEGLRVQLVGSVRAGVGLRAEVERLRDERDTALEQRDRMQRAFDLARADLHALRAEVESLRAQDTRLGARIDAGLAAADRWAHVTNADAGMAQVNGVDWSAGACDAAEAIERALRGES